MLQFICDSRSERKSTPLEAHHVGNEVCETSNGLQVTMHEEANAVFLASNISSLFLMYTTWLLG